MFNKRSLAVCSMYLAFLLFSVVAVAQESHIRNLTGNAKRGKALYQRYCIFCHGKYGDGRGDSAAYLNPRPRDFTLGVFKCRSTPSGNLPLDSDLFDTISRGIHLSGMPAWRPLTRENRADLVAYVKSFSSKFGEQQPGPPLTIPPEPASSEDSVKRGGELYQTLNCALCHGKEGRGNGPSAPTLTDNKGYAIAPFDLTSGTHLKCGEGDAGIFRDLTTGLDGTPMPSIADAANVDQRWDIVHYIATLRAEGHNPPKQAKIMPDTK